MTDSPVYRMLGNIGILKSQMRRPARIMIKDKLFLKGRAWRDNPPIEVRAWSEDDDYFWVPRFFFSSAIKSGTIGKHPVSIEWTEGEPQDLPEHITLEEKRGQPKAVDGMEAFLRKKSGGLLIAPTGAGKCLGKGTLVLLANGRTIPVERIKVGDRLMGPDGQPRNVLSVTAGRGPLYKINPVKGEPWVCNDVHVLTLVHTETGKVIDISLDEWQKRTNYFKHCHKLFSVAIDEFEESPPPPPVDPYFLGLWFGDGTKVKSTVGGKSVLSAISVSKPDVQVAETCKTIAKRWGLRTRISQINNRCPTIFIARAKSKGVARMENPLLSAMRDLVGSSIRIPDCVIRGSREVRLQFLAGFLDADAELTRNCFFVCQKRQDWARNIWWIARSLGFRATFGTRMARNQYGFTGQYFTVAISGDTDEIPTRLPRKQATARKQKKNPRRTGFSVEALGEGDYYGFTLDRDGRFLLGDFTVTHNTLLGYAIGRRFKTSIGVLVYNGHMLDNWVSTADQIFGLSESDVGVVQGDRCDIGKPVTVMMVQSLLSRVYPEELYNQVGFLIADEVNRYAAPVWNDVVQQFPARYRLGLSADPSRKDGLDPLIAWHFGDVGHKVKMRVPKPTVVQICYGIRYKESRYRDYLGQNEDGSVVWGDANPIKYNKVAARDEGRNEMIIDEIVNARQKKRRILVFSAFREHLDILKRMFEAAWDPGILNAIADDDSGIIENLSIPTRTTLLVGGLKAEQRAEAMEGDVVFTTYALARDALNMPSIDTLVFATPPGNPLQPIGRLRDKGAEDRRPLLALDIFEKGSYSERKASRRRSVYSKLGIKVKSIDRKPRQVK